jgi:ribosomal protein S18 acetylase RimI-like enzyme
MDSMRIRPYDPSRDEGYVYGLWQETLGSLWPVSQAAFHHKTVDNEAYRSGDHFVAEIGGTIVGFVATQVRTVPGEDHPRGQLMVLLVDPRHQRRQIGRALLDHALASLRRKSVIEAQLGSGGLAYFWAGAPTNLPDAWAFFQACGWSETVRSFDLVRELGDYVTPPEVYERVRAANVSLVDAAAADIPAILAFEARYFPAWLRYYEMAVEQGAHADIVLARDAGGTIVGTSYVTDFRTESGRVDFVWQPLLGDNTGGVGTLGVAETMRGRGIGLALAARVTERLQSQGLATSYIGYTWLVDWYGKLGYRVWRDYHLSQKSL